MKNELLARAMTQIDSALIDEANEMPTKKATVLTPAFLAGIKRYGALAACLVLIVGAIIAVNSSTPGVLLYGEPITANARNITEYIPASFTAGDEESDMLIPLELDFKKSTILTTDNATIVALDSDGNEIFRGKTYTAKGVASIMISLSTEERRATIATNKGYDIVLEKDEQLGLWYVFIDK